MAKAAAAKAAAAGPPTSSRARAMARRERSRSRSRSPRPAPTRGTTTDRLLGELFPPSSPTPRSSHRSPHRSPRPASPSSSRRSAAKVDRLLGELLPAVSIQSQPRPGFETPERIHRGLVLEIPSYRWFKEAGVARRSAAERRGRRVPRVSYLPPIVEIGNGFDTLNDVMVAYLQGDRRGEEAFHRMLDIAVQYGELRR